MEGRLTWGILGQVRICTCRIASNRRWRTAGPKCITACGTTTSVAITSAGFLEVEGLKGVWRVGVRGGVLEVQGEVTT